MGHLERRKFQRLQLRLPISELSALPEARRIRQLWTTNVSAGGMSFEMPAGAAPPDGAVVSFELTVPPGEGYAASESRLRGAGRVVRKAVLGSQSVAVALHFNRPLAISFSS